MYSLNFWDSSNKEFRFLFFQIGSVLLAVISFKRKKDRNFSVSFAQFSNLISLSSFKFSFVSLKFKLQKFRAASSSSIRTGLHGRNNFELVSRGKKKKKKKEEHVANFFSIGFREFAGKWAKIKCGNESRTRLKKWFSGQSGTIPSPLSPIPIDFE